MSPFFCTAEIAEIAEKRLKNLCVLCGLCGKSKSATQNVRKQNVVSLEKVTAFITRQTQTGIELLLFEHPNAGIQIPAGTVEVGETVEAAALREAQEESGLSGLKLLKYLDAQEERPVIGDRFVAQATSVYARPDPDSFKWARFRRGITVRVLRQADGFTHATYEEPNRWPDPQYITYQITGWVPDEALVETVQRYFYLFSCDGDTPDRWTVPIDHHIFAPFWAPLIHLPDIVQPQKDWLDVLRSHYQVTAQD